MCETQQLMALRPEMIDLGRPEPSPCSGSWCGTPFRQRGLTPDAMTGEGIVSSQVASLGAIEKELLAAYRPAPNWTVPDQDQLDAIWHDFDELTRKYWVLSLSWDEYRKGAANVFPGWEALGVRR